MKKQSSFSAQLINNNLIILNLEVTTTKGISEKFKRVYFSVSQSLH